MSFVTVDNENKSKILEYTAKILEKDGFCKKTVDETLFGAEKILSACDKSELYEVAFSEEPEKMFRRFIDGFAPHMSFDKIGWYMAALRILCRALNRMQSDGELNLSDESSGLILSEPDLISAGEMLKRYDDEYKSNACSIKKFISDSGKKNDDICIVLKKLELIENVFSIKCKDIFKTAEIIFQANVDADIEIGDEEAVEKLFSRLNTDIKGGRENMYTIACAFCAIHNEKRYPLCNSYSFAALKYFRDNYCFYGFNNEDLFKYSKYKKILSLFKRKYKLDGLPLFGISRLLTAYGKILSEH